MTPYEREARQGLAILFACLAVCAALWAVLLLGPGCGPGRPNGCRPEREEKHDACSAAPSSAECRIATHALAKCEGERE